MRYALGIDLGCTNTRVALVDTDGQILAAGRQPTEAARGAEHVVTSMVSLARRVLADGHVAPGGIAGLGVGSPGEVDHAKGVVVNATDNLPGWQGMPLGERLSEELALPAFVDNDTNVIALGEHTYGAAMFEEDFVCLALGSGVGGSVFLGGKPLRGSRLLGGRLGHIAFEPEGRLCNCGRTGCLEAYASAWAIAERAKSRIRAGGTTLIQELAEGDVEAVTAKTVIDAAREGDLFALVVVGEVARALATAIADISAIVDPALFLLTGGAAHDSPELIARVRSEFEAVGAACDADAPRIVGGALRDDAGVIGAAVMAFAGGVPGGR
jgi:glucokinase